MATTPVKLKVKDYKEREVLKVHYEFTQATDVEGQMAGIPRGGKIYVKVKAMNDGTPDLMAWMVEPNLAKNGEISFNETKSGKLMKRIMFEDAYCVHYHEHWEEGAGHYEEIVISCRVMKFDGDKVNFENTWA